MIMVNKYYQMQMFVDVDVHRDKILKLPVIHVVRLLFSVIAYEQ